MTSKRFWIAGMTCIAALSSFSYLCIRSGRSSVKVPPSGVYAAPDIADGEERATLLRRKGYAELSLQLTNYGYLNATAQVNGEPWLFYLDTGATDNMVDELVPVRHKLATVPSERFMIGVGGKTKALPKIVIEQFAFGGVQRKLDSLVIDMSGQNKSRLERNDPLPDGLLSGIFLAQYRAVICYNPATLFLRPQDSTSTSIDKPLHDPAGAELSALLKAQGYHEMPLLLCKNKFLCAAVKIHGERARFMVDTGAMSSLIDPTAVERLHLPVEAAGIVVHGLGGNEAAAKKTTISAFAIESIQTPLEALLADLSAQNAELQKDGDAPYDGILSASVLRRFEAVIDYGCAKLFLREPKAR